MPPLHGVQAAPLDSSPGDNGRKLKTKATVANVMTALEHRASGSSMPSAALADRRRPTGAHQRGGEGRRSADGAAVDLDHLLRGGEGNFWNANIHIPAWDLDGKVIAPGEWFEFWQGIGPVTLERGYGYGGAIIGGRSVPNGALAGGICSTSTTLFNAAMRAGLEIGQRENHSYYIDRYPMGLDATVFKTDS